MSFRPSLHGWPYANEFAADGLAGLGSPPFPELGLGGGMCWSALDRYLAGVRISRGVDAPAPGEPLYAELVSRQVAALGAVRDRVMEWQELPDGSWRDRIPLPGALLPVGSDLTSRTRAEWKAVRRKLVAGEPVLLTLLAEADGYTRSRAAWQVLAYGYSREGGRVMLSVYDPSRPDDDDFRLAFGLRGALDAKLTGGRPIRGFLAAGYDRSRQPSLRAETFADRAVIGLNRKVQGRVAPAVSRRGLDLVARDPDGALLHFRRKRGRHWEGANVTERADLGASELYSDPVAVRSLGALHVFARNYVGDLLHFSHRRGWGVANRTDNRRAGPRFRLDGEPVAVAAGGGGVSVVARSKDGLLLHYTGSPVSTWIVEEISPAGNHPLGGDPVAVRVGKAVHVVARSQEGHVLHFERMRSGWSSADATKEAFPQRTVRLAGQPAALVHEGQLQVFGRDTEENLVRLVRDADGRWTGELIMDGVHGDPAPTRGPAGLHVFALGRGGTLLHAWQDRGWRSEDVPGSRPALDAQPLQTPLLAWGDAQEIRVFGRAGGELWIWSWRRDSDWFAGPVSERAGAHEGHRTGEMPLLVVDHQDRPHLFATDGGGTVLHLELGEWLEPDPVRQRPIAAAPRVSGADPAASATPAAASAPEPEPAGEADDAEVIRLPVEGPGPRTEPSPRPAGARPASAAPAPAPVPKIKRKISLKTGPKRVPSTPRPADDESLPFLDELPASEGGPGEAGGNGASNGAADHGGNGAGERTFSWTDEEPDDPGTPAAFEPMDLSIMDSWPKEAEPTDGKPRKKKKKA